jgi:hypothetical protein
MESFGSVATIVTTRGVVLSQLFHVASLGFYWLSLLFGVGVATIYIATLGVCFPNLYHVIPGTIYAKLSSFSGVVTLAVGLPASSCLMASPCFSWPDLEF